MTLATVSFWQQAALNAIGPLTTAVVGLLLVGLAINFVTRAVQDRRAANELKYGLISEITETASTLYHHIVQYDRAKIDPADEEYKRLRKKLLDQYPTSRAQAEVLQARLTVYFEDPRVAVAWHAVRDCLTVRYYHEVSGAETEHWDQISDENRKGYKKGYHTGLSPRRPY